LPNRHLTQKPSTFAVFHYDDQTLRHCEAFDVFHDVRILIDVAELLQNLNLRVQSLTYCFAASISSSFIPSKSIRLAT
jgi:hypothetical protein